MVYCMCVHKSESTFLCQAVEYIGQQVDGEELHTLDTKVVAIPSPKDVRELHSFLELGDSLPILYCSL